MLEEMESVEEVGLELASYGVGEVGWRLPAFRRRSGSFQHLIPSAPALSKHVDLALLPAGITHHSVHHRRIRSPPHRSEGISSSLHPLQMPVL